MITLETMEKSSLLLKYAAENISDNAKKATFVSAATQIEACRDANANNQWTPATAGQFWTSYIDLCSLISPVNIDTLTASQALLPNSKYTLPQLWVRRYIILFVFLLTVSVTLSFVTTAVTSVNTEMNTLITSANTTADGIVKSLAILRRKIGADDQFAASTDADVQIETGKLETALPILYAAADKLFAKSNSVPELVLAHYPKCQDNQNPETDTCYKKGGGGIAKSINDAQENVENYRFFSRRLSDRVEISQSRIDLVKATLLPMLLGMTGAVAYVIRMMSEQIRTSSFSSSSPIRNIARVMLGALAGVAIGFTGVLANSAVSGAALSFISGYAIEPVFATFDKIAATFK
jgi:hypothetical protein